MMKRHMVHRVAALLDILAEILECEHSEMISVLFFIDKLRGDEIHKIETVLNEMDE